MTDAELGKVLDTAISKSDKHWFDMYRINLGLKDWFAYLDYVEKHEHNKYHVYFAKLKHCITKIEFTINYN